MAEHLSCFDQSSSGARWKAWSFWLSDSESFGTNAADRFYKGKKGSALSLVFTLHMNAVRDAL